MKRSPVLFTLLLTAAALAPPSGARAQVTAADHKAQHPQQSPAPAMKPGSQAADSSGGMTGAAKGGGMGGGMEKEMGGGAGMGGGASDSAKSGGMGGSSGGGMGGDGGGGMGGGGGGGMGAGMGEMMGEMGKPAAKELFPTMMQLPEQAPENRAEARHLADARVREGNLMLTAGLEKLTAAAQMQDDDAMQVATAQIRHGQALLQSGYAARWALADDRADPRTTAAQWFKREMKLAPADHGEQPHGFFGLSWFHYVTMLTLAAFAAAMIWMYFHKMKRANALIEKLAGTAPAEVPPPGGTPPAPPDAPATKVSGGAPPVASAAKPAVVNPDIAPTKSNSWTGTLLVADIFEETPQVKTFRLTDPAGGKLPFVYLPGQFITVSVVPDGIPVKRSYTIASSPTNRDSCEITVKHEEHGTASHYLNTQVHEGELLQFVGPSGKFTFTESEADCIVLIAGGVGVTPMMSIIRYLTDRSWKRDIFFFYTCKNESTIIFREEIEYLRKRYPNLHVCLLLDEVGENAGNRYLPGRITKEIIAERVPDIATRRIHVCGPPPMIDAVRQMLDELKVPKENVRVEAFAGKPAAPKPAPAVPAAEGQPAAPDAAPGAPDEAGGAAVVTFARSNKTAVLTPEKSVLEASEDVGVNIDFSCRVGTCGLCKVKLLAGKVTMAVEDALDENDKAQNTILACQAKASEAISVDA